jgi:ribulose-bisphosphate carboxylase large chain
MDNVFRNIDSIDISKYFIVTYYLEAKTSLKEAAWSLAIGQSIGNPKDRSIWETDEIFENHSCVILDSEKILETRTTGQVKIAFPLANINLEEDGISQILCHIAGGQVDILEVRKCNILDITLPEDVEKEFRLLPAYGINKWREFNGVKDKPFFGGIVKPKVGMSPEVLLEVVKEMVAGGVNFIKEDELLGNPEHCPLEVRVPLISDWLNKNAPNVIYCFCINGDSPYVLKRAKFVAENGGKGVHINVWSGLGIYRAIRKENPNLWIHFQKAEIGFLPTHVIRITYTGRLYAK